MEDAKNSQADFIGYLRSISKRNKNKEKINRLLNGRNDPINFIKSYGPKILETKRRAKNEIGLKMLPLKQMLQRLPMALSQVQAGNNTENLLNEIRQIVYSLYKSKEITEKVNNSIIK